MSKKIPKGAATFVVPLAGPEARRHPALHRIKTTFIWAGLLAGALMLFQLPAFAQEGTILGTVTDPSGAAVPNATITVLNTDTGAVRKLTANATGEYVAPDLPIGHYTVTAEAQGFTRAEHTGVVLTIAETLRQDFALQLGEARQTVTVEAAPVEVQKDSAAVSTMITGQQVTEIATNGRSFYNLVALIPGASSKMPSFQTSTPVGGNASVSINGQREVHNIYLLDGGEDLDRGGGGTMSIMPSEEGIAEFRAETSNYSAQYGLSSAGTMTMALKSGTDKFHAEAWEFDRNDWFDAVAPNATNVSKLRMNVYGFNVGGPVALHESGNHNTFFFYNMEWRKYILASGVIHTAVPDQSVYGGVFPSSLTAAQLHTPCLNQVDATIAAQYTAAGQTLSTADSTGACGPPPATPPAGYVPATLVQFTNNNTIPSGLLDKNAQALLTAGVFPLPTPGQAAGKEPYYSYFNAPVSAPTDLREETTRIDHRFSDKFSVFGHYVSEQINQDFATTMWSGDNVPTIGNTFGNPSYSAVVHTTYSISPTLLNEAAFNYNGNRIHILPLGLYGAPSGFTFNRVFTGPNVDNRIPSISLSGLEGTNYTTNWVPWNNAADDYQLRDDISWVKGNHQLKFGGSWALYKKVQDVFASTQGGFTFNGFYTGNDFADFLLGDSASYSENAVHDNGHWNNISWAAYIEDNWHPTRRLTLNLGLRWDGIPHTYEANNRYSNFYPNMWNPADAATFLANGTINPTGPAAGALGPGANPIISAYQFYLNGVGISGHSGVPHGMVNDAWWNFGPRLGFAYDVTGTGKTIVRAGFGVMYERIQGNDMYDGATDVPFSASYSTSNVSLSNPTLNIGTGAQFSPAAAPVLVTSFTGLASNAYAAPVIYQYSATVERQLNPKLVLSMGYVGSQSRHQSYYGQYNLPPQSDLANLATTGDAAWNTLVPYLGFSSIQMAINEENAYYNSLQVQLRGQATRDLTLQVSYTLSKTVDGSPDNGNGGDLDTLYNPYNWGYTYGPSTYDRRNAFVANFIYNLPFLRNSPSRALRTGLGGWGLSGILTMESGLPLNITEGGKYGSNGVQSGATNLPNFSGSVSYPKTDGAWFGTSGFTEPTPGSWGTFPYDSIYGPGFYNWDLSLFKNFQISAERGSHLEFRLETFNAFNHSNPNSVSSTFSSGNFGQVTGWADPRTLQLGLRLFF